MTHIDLCPFTKMNDNTRKAIMSFSHNAVDEIDNLGMDDNRFFCHLKEGFDWNDNQHNQTKSFGTVKEMKNELKNIRKIT